jgi:ribonuclease E
VRQDEQQDEPQPASDLAVEPTSAAAEQHVPTVVLGLPVEVHERPVARLEPIEAADLLDSVLEALPAPKAAGQGRRRSRRVSTPALTPGQDD